LTRLIPKAREKKTGIPKYTKSICTARGVPRIKETKMMQNLFATGIRQSRARAIRVPIPSPAIMETRARNRVVGINLRVKTKIEKKV
jgi:hypothetical protein